MPTFRVRSMLYKNVRTISEMVTIFPIGERISNFRLQVGYSILWHNLTKINSQCTPILWLDSPHAARLLAHLLVAAKLETTFMSQNGLSEIAAVRLSPSTNEL